MFSQVIISGSTGSAFVLKGKRWETLQQDHLEKWQGCSFQQVSNLVAISKDWTLLEKPKLDYGGVQDMLQAATARHDVLHFCLMGLDEEYSSDLRLDALTYCEELLQQHALSAHLRGILFSTPIPPSADFVGAIGLVASGFPLLNLLLQQVWRAQDQISAVAQAWMHFVSDSLRGAAVKVQLRQGLIDNGYFAALCLQLGQPDLANFDRLILDHSKLRQPIPKVNVAIVLQEFHVYLHAAIGLQQERKKHQIVAEEEDEQGRSDPASLEDQTLALLKEYIDKGGRPLTKGFIESAKIQAKVSEQILEIESAIHDNQPELARKLFFYLLQYQTAYSFRANILMTCTNLLNIARRAGDFAFLETVLLAASALDTTDVVFLNSKAEILKVQGRLQDALDAYDAVINAHPQDAVAQNGRAEVLKAQGRLHEALGAYETVINAHPQDVVAQTGRAEVLKALGRLQDAIDAYDAVVKAHPQNAVAQNGRAEVLKAQGKLQVALDAYDAVIKAHPQNAVAQNGRAEVLKSQGRLQEALAAYDAVIQAHPQDTFAQNGRLSILILLGILSNDDWEVLLQENPKSENDWIRYHLGCMALIQNNENHWAVEKLDWGLRNTPFDSDRAYFISALATAYIGAQEYREGLRWLDKLGNYDTSAIASARRRILMAHALFAEEKQAEGIQILNALQSSEYPLLQRAKDALQARYVANPSPEQSRLLDDEIRIIEFQLMVA